MGRTLNAANHDKIQRAGWPVSAYPVTLASWVYPTSFATDTWPIMAEAVTTGAGYLAIAILANAQCRAQIDSSNFISATVAQTTTTIALNAWSHLCAVFKSGTNGARIYVNGVQRASVTNNETFPTGDTWIAGGDVRNNSRWFAGNLAEQGVWNAELTDLEIESLAAGTPASRVRATTLQLYWPLHGLASPEPDLSGNGLVGTVTGAVAGTHAPVNGHGPIV